MKNILLSLICLASATTQAMEYESQFEDDQICIAKIKIEPYEEIKFDVYPEIVIAFKEAVITRIERDGRTTEVQFPTGTATVREKDSKDAFYKNGTNSSEPLELVIIQLKNTPPIENKPENSHDISINIQINCPESDEFQEFIKSIPPAGNYSSSFDEWKSSFINNMNHLVYLVESKNIFNSWWSVNTDVKLPQKNQEK
jgi:hypothetical protein